MNIYLAAKYERRQEMYCAALSLEHFGHTVTSRWIRGMGPFIPAAAENDRPEVMALCAQMDLDDLMSADAILLFSNPTDEFNRGGRHVEFGIAVASGKRLVVIGRRENVFHFLPRVEVYPTLDAFLEAAR